MSGLINLCVLMLLVIASALTLIVPEVDLAFSSLFFESEKGFAAAHAAWAKLLHLFANLGARVCGVFIILLLVYSWLVRPRPMGLDRKQWLFLLLVLLAGPGLVANVVFKDQWGRARPHQVTQFNGPALFTAPMVVANQCHTNCSFIGGDAAFAFSLHAIGYVATRHRRRWVAGGLLAGCAMGLTRIAMGAHFLSDIVFAGIFMLITTAVLYMIMFNEDLFARWRQWLTPGRVRPTD